jgi:PiT family inorganic phosphate transporter
MLATIAIVLLGLLAASNGANDVSKGIATLAGSGVARYRAAIVWGAATTLAGCLLSGALAGQMLKLFSSGIVSEPPTPAFTLAVLCGTAGWVALATKARLPVSTTHALVGSLVGAGLLFAPSAVVWAGLAQKVALPLVASIAISYALSAALNVALRERSPAAANECVCVQVAEADTGVARLPIVHVTTCPSASEAATRPGTVGFDLSLLHWLSSGAVGFARGLNDTPKLVAIGVGLASSGVTAGGLALYVAAAMFVGALVGGLRVAKVLGENVVKMSHREGLLANLATAGLVGFGANLGLPMSTTHVSTGAIAGIAGGDLGRLNKKTLRDLALAWTVTPLVAATVAAIAYLAFVRLGG